jgi:uncharacterized protein
LRIIILAGLIYLLYRALKRWMAIEFVSARKDAFPKTKEQLDDLMVKDPFCGTFFPKREGVQVRIKGEAYFFCSEACRDSFLKQDTNDITS